MPPDIIYAYVWVDDQIRVDAAVECGKRFDGIAWILDPNSRIPKIPVSDLTSLLVLGQSRPSWIGPR